MWIWHSMMLSPPEYNTTRIHKHNQLTQYAHNVFFLQKRVSNGSSSEGCFSECPLQIQLMWCINLCKLMDHTVVSYKSSETPGTPKPLQAQPQGFHKVWFTGFVGFSFFNHPLPQTHPLHLSLLGTDSTFMSIMHECQ